MKIMELDPVFNSYLAVRDKDGALRAIARQLLEPRGYSRDIIEIAYQSLWERERLGSTGIGDGFAYPHGFSPIGDVLCGFFITPPLEFQSLDGEPTRIIVCTMVPLRTVGLHLKILARTSLLTES
jgi:mannitol/fructose-specific phosphotransferase system IIA component (Ntr-type)